MIRITKISNLRNLGDYQNEFDEVWTIVRSLRNPIRGVQQVAELSPSVNLLTKYKRKADEGNWNAQTFAEMYVPRFIDEIRGSSAALDKLGYLYNADKAGKKICLLCFCGDETICHRSIVAGFLQGVGCNVKLDTDNDYRKYHKMLMSK